MRKNSHHNPPRLIQAESETITHWLRHATKARAHLSVKERLEALLWSWPVLRALKVRTPRPLWKHRDERTTAVESHLDSLATTLYPPMDFPEAHYSADWAPHDAPLHMQDDEFQRRCHTLCEQVRALPPVAVPDPHDDTRWLCHMLEYRWGDHGLEVRREEQQRVVKALDEQTQRRVCKIGERARDAAYRHIRVNRVLDELREDKARAKSFLEWLRRAPEHAPFVETHLPREAGPHATPLTQTLVAFTATFRTLALQRKEAAHYVWAYMKNTFEDPGRDRRSNVGPPARGPWVDPADGALKKLKKLSLANRRTLLLAWSLAQDPPPNFRQKN